MSQTLLPEDPALIERLRDEHTARRAFSEVIGIYSQPLYRQIRRIVQNHDDANDVLQNTFMKAWASLPAFRGEARLTTWLFKIAINESITFLAREQRRRSLSDAEMTQYLLDNIEADSYVDGDTLALELRKAVALLPEKQRLVFNMKYYDDLKYEQMSDILGTSVGALKASYHLAVKKIEQFFSDSD